jgi:protoheme IX farnesyltransferase
VLIGLGGAVYGAVSLAGGAMFLLLAWRVFNSRAGETANSFPEPAPAGRGWRGEGLYDPKAEARPARDLFAYSILYLFGLFAALLGEQVWRMWA